MPRRGRARRILITLRLWSVTAARSVLRLPVTVEPCCVVTTVPTGWRDLGM